MSNMLASVSNLMEAKLVLDAGVDIIDLKQPAAGALGALETTAVRAIVTAIAGQTPISATIGDLPMQAEIIIPAVKTMAATGVDYLKIGFFPGGDWSAVLAGLTAVAAEGHTLIAVLFADAQPDFSVLPRLHAAGFKGVMLDTMYKQQGSLLQVLPFPQLSEFIALAKQLGLLTGLAGSLRLEDINQLLPLHADYLGFRGALCMQQQRTQALNPLAIQSIIHMLHVNNDGT